MNRALLLTLASIPALVFVQNAAGQNAVDQSNVVNNIPPENYPWSNVQARLGIHTQLPAVAAGLLQLVETGLEHTTWRHLHARGSLNCARRRRRVCSQSVQLRSAQLVGRILGANSACTSPCTITPRQAAAPKVGAPARGTK